MGTKDMTEINLRAILRILIEIKAEITALRIEQGNLKQGEAQ